MFFDSNQLYTAFLVVFVAIAMASLLVFHREGSRKKWREIGVVVLGTCAVLSVASWLRFGDMHSIWVDAPDATANAPHRRKIEKHQPLHFHEFFHYYLGAKYFRDLGYEGLYDCTALGDKENAEADGQKGHIGEWVRDLDDVLRDKSFTTAITRCQTEYVDKMPAAHWAAFKADLRELQRLVPDDWWSDVVYDAGFNPPPSWVLLGGAIANVVPIRLGGTPSYLLATSLDMALILGCFLALRRCFGNLVAITAGIYFGASFIASYGWNGGCFLRYTWVSAIVFGLCFASRGRWTLAGVLLAWAACDRVFPAGFAVGAILPIAWRALVTKVPDDRVRLKQFAIGFGATAAVLVLLSTAIFGVDAWRVFITRIGRHSDVYYTMHIGLKKVVTWRDWVPGQNFHGHVGLERFHDWNVRLRDTWKASWWFAIPIQFVALGGACAAAVRRRPHEASLIVGAIAMFCFALPANYYYVVLALVPAVLLRSAITAPTGDLRVRHWIPLTAFGGFWLTTLLVPRLYGDDIVYDHFICVALLLFYGIWIASWLPAREMLAALRARRARATTPAPSEPSSAS